MARVAWLFGNMEGGREVGKKFRLIKVAKLDDIWA